MPCLTTHLPFVPKLLSLSAALSPQPPCDFMSYTGTSLLKYSTVIITSVSKCKRLGFHRAIALFVIVKMLTGYQNPDEHNNNI
jgi:hypothetical protein